MLKPLTRNVLKLHIGVLFIAIYCEFLIYYVVIVQCSWPIAQSTGSPNQLNALIVADTHLLGPYRGHWLDKWRREWQMHRAFQTIMTVHKPEVVFVLGDLFDEGEWCNKEQFIDYVDRFNRLFSVPDDAAMYVVVGNHDIGFHGRMRPGAAKRFSELFNAPSVRIITIKDNHFFLINSMAMEGDSCQLCREARYSIEKISANLKCSMDPSQCPYTSKMNYSRPILMQHFPLYRTSDAICTEPDAPPIPQRNKRFRNKIDSLSLEATKYLKKKIRPRAAFGGHTHFGCLVLHEIENEQIEFYEYSVPSFSWRNIPNPKYMLVSISPESYAVNKCGLPKETTIALTAVILFFLLSFYVLK